MADRPALRIPVALERPSGRAGRKTAVTATVLAVPPGAFGGLLAARTFAVLGSPGRQVPVSRAIKCGTAQAPQGRGIEAAAPIRLIHEIKEQCRNQHVTAKGPARRDALRYFKAHALLLSAVRCANCHSCLSHT